MGRYTELDWARAGADAPATTPRRDDHGDPATLAHLKRDPLDGGLIAACTGVLLLRRLCGLVPGG